VSAVLLAAGALLPTPARAQPTNCDDPRCVPGIASNVVLGSYRDNTTNYEFGATSWSGWRSAARPDA
jgi:hypothetical protein